MSNILPVVTLYQPWASWVIWNWKPIETRTHARFACLKGKTILIHAGQKTDKTDQAIRNPYLLDYQKESMISLIRPNGYLLGTARVKHFDLLSEFNSQEALIDCGNVKRWGLFMDMVNEFEHPIPCKGGMGIWYYDLDNHVKVKKTA